MNKIISIFFLLSLIIFFSYFLEKDDLEVHFLDIGQGDAILIRTPQGQNILIDGGPDNKLLYRVGEVLPWWEREIDYLIVTHFDADHFVGFIELMNKYKVKNVLVNGNQYENSLYKAWQEGLSQKNISPQIARAGQRFLVDDDLSWQVIWLDLVNEDKNENSIVIKLTYKDDDFLFTGDLGILSEEKILTSGIDISADYLKVGHHGSNHSSSNEFLQAVHPKFCIIQSGKENSFGHPHQEVLDRLTKVGCQILDNQSQGTISFFID